MYVGISAPAGKYKKEHLRYFNNRLMLGSDRRIAKDFSDADYMVMLIEGRANRPDWASLPELSGFEAKFSTALAADQHDDRVKALAAPTKEFVNAVNSSKNLSAPDKTLVVKLVQTDLQKRLDQLKGTVFELKAAGAANPASAAFDFLNLGNRPKT